MSRRPFKKLKHLTTTPAISQRMARVRQAGTAPELGVRAACSGLGLRYRIRNRDLPGSPDLANRTWSWAIFVHGCYWHRHAGCSKATTPRSNIEFWLAKFARNKQRDRASVAALKRQNFRVLTVWQCEAELPERLARRLRVFFADQGLAAIGEIVGGSLGTARGSAAG